MAPGNPMGSEQQVVEVDSLRELLKKMFVKKGMFGAEAKVGAERLVEADLLGLEASGSQSIGRFLTAMDNAEIDSRAQIVVEQESPAIAVMNGGMGLGHVAATKAMQLAITKANEVGTGTIAVKRSHDPGAAVCYALLAAEKGCIGICVASGGQAACAIPIQGRSPFVIDSSQVPPSAPWSMLPPLLAGGLVGASISVGEGNSHHVFYAVDPGKFTASEKFAQRLNEYVETASKDSSEAWAGLEERHQQAGRWLSDGIPFQSQHLDDLAKIAAGLKLDVPW